MSAHYQKLRNKAKLSIADAARKLGVCTATAYNYEKQAPPVAELAMSHLVTISDAKRKAEEKRGNI